MKYCIWNQIVLHSNALSVVRLKLSEYNMQIFDVTPDTDSEGKRFITYPQEIDEDVSTTMVRKAARHFASWQKGNFWKDANGDVLPEIDKDVIALEGLDKGNNYRVVFAHRVDPDRVIRTTIDNKPLELHPSRYGEAGWNLPNIKYWLDLELPKKV